MFVQIIRGQVLDREGYQDQMDEWEQELKPGATGYLGMTGGVTADGTSITVVRFESEAAAQANSNRPEQGEWWERTSKYLEDVTFTDSSDVSIYREGGSDQAGFVQVIEGRVSDRARFEALMEEFESAQPRPDVIGGLTAWRGDQFTTVMHFTSEAEAREGERAEPPEALKAIEDEWQSLLVDPQFTDLTEPVFDSAG